MIVVVGHTYRACFHSSAGSDSDYLIRAYPEGRKLEPLYVTEGGLT